MFTGEQEAAIVNLVLENNEIRLNEKFKATSSKTTPYSTTFNESVCPHWLAFSSENKSE